MNGLQIKKNYEWPDCRTTCRAKEIVSPRELEGLKKDGGPFTNAEQVETFLDNVNDENRKMAQKRLRDEVTYARDTSTSLPRAHI